VKSVDRRVGQVAGDGSIAGKRQAALQLLAILQGCYPQAHCALNYSNPLELLVATVLSAQCTDVRVNLVTPALFAAYPDAAALAAADLAKMEALIHSTGFFRTKARNLRAMAAVLQREHGGEVPRDLDTLVALPGVGRKTANVVLGNAFGIPAMVVDTHVGRLARRFGWAGSKQPQGVEAELCALLPSDHWTQASHLLIFHGRQCCKSQQPLCSGCPVGALCPRIGVTRSR
jgi:endonuclease III